MMNPQYLPPGQNNNAPTNPLGYPPSSQDINGHPNANIYNQMQSNGPAPQMMPPMNPGDMAQKMQGMNLNGPQGFIPPSQLPPGQLPPTSNYGQPPSQMPQGFRPPVSSQQLPPSSVAQKPPTSAPGPGFGQMPQPNMGQQNQGFMPGGPMQQGPKMQPLSQPSQPGIPGMQPNQQGLGQQPPMLRQPGLPPQPGQMPNQMPSAPGLPQQTGMPPQSGMPQQPGMPPKAQPGQMPQPGQQMPQPGQQMPPPGQQMPPPGQQMPPPGQQMPPPGQQMPPPGQQMPPPGQQMPQPGQLPQQGQMPQKPPMAQPGQPPFGQPGSNQGQPQTQPSNQGFPALSQAGFQQSLPGMPHMPPPLSQRQYQAPTSQPGYGKPPGQQAGGFQGQQQIPGQPPMPGQQPQMPGHQPPMPGQQLPGQQMPGQQQPRPGQPPMPGQHPPMPGQPPMQGQRQMPGQPPMPGQPMPGHHQMPGQPPMPGQQMHNQPPMPGQQPMYGQQPGMPPMPGGQSGYPPQYAPFPAQQPSYDQHQPKKLDPDQMPSPIEVMLDDQQNRGGIFVTNDKGLVPPLVTTDFIVDDKGNASPRYIRSSMYSVPVTADLLKQTTMPFCLVISPMAETVGAEQEPPLLDFAALTGSPTLGPVRCTRCKAYICPFMKFVDAGRHFKCAFCKATTEVPMEYTQYINSMQQYGRLPAELALGTYEIAATKEYCRNNTLPNPPAIIFVLDVSYNSVKNGLLQTVCDNIMSIIEAMPKDEQTGKSYTRVGFITYSSTVHFYNIKGSLAQPQMLSVGDVSDMFVPLLEGFLQTPEEAGPVLPALIKQLPEMFADNKETEIILLPAVQAGLEALKAAECSGQLLVFHTSLPSLQAPGRLANREDRKLLGTDKEKQILAPQTTEYNEVGAACAAAGVSVELFLANNSYVDVATVGQLARLTGGMVHKFTYFTPETDGARLVCAAVRVAGRPTAHDAVMRVRTSSGVRATDFIGHFYMANTTDVELAAIDADKAIGVEIKHDDKLTGEDGVYIQAALLYTSRSGSRRLRVINLSLNVAQQLADVYRSSELDTLVNYLTRQAVWSLRETAPRAVREGLSTRCARCLAAYRRHCASPSAPGQLVLPEAMKLLPLYTNCLLRADAIAGGPDISCDERSVSAARALTADVVTSCALTYPRLLALSRLPRADALRASVSKMSDDGVYLLENGVHMLLWVGSLAPPQLCRDLFGVDSAQQVDTRVCELPALDNPVSEAARALVSDIRTKRRNFMRLTMMKQHDKLEAVLRHFLVEDRGVDGSSSYVDYLCHIHKEIRALL